MNTLRSFLTVATFALPFAASAALADVRLPTILGSNMVVQQAGPFTLWGWADAGEEIVVTASFPSTPAKAVAGADGRWTATIDVPSLSAAIELKSPAAADLAKPQTITIKGRSTLTLSNLLIGEVWVCGGQSNMEWTLRGAQDGEAVALKANHPTIRLFDVVNTCAAEPAADCASAPLGGQAPGWVECGPKTAADFSAVGYFFGVALVEKLKVPVGLVACNWGGTPAEAWAEEGTIKKYEAFAGPLAKSKEKGAVLSPNMPTVLFNGMIAPISKLSIRGAIWYQGESNVGRADQYATLFPAMIKDWRAAFNRPIPFYFVQIAPFAYGNDTGQAAALRIAQSDALALDGTGMVVTLDIGDPKDIHPRDKKTVGERLAAWSFCRTYGFPATECTGPFLTTLDTLANHPDVLVAHFSNNHIMKALGDPIEGFEIAGADGKWVKAKAEIVPQGITLKAAGVNAPVKARYAWCSGCEGLTIIKNHWGYPMRPFVAAVIRNDTQIDVRDLRDVQVK